ncbi:hypothetical protein [Solicola sp. PLA-1-18]|uniref:TPR repeat region-containing protein n=1 Tax=Solicola sp. PLA-1-18 TaxID=3380532 RepID=UPI003B827D2A
MPEIDLFPAHASSPEAVRAEADRLTAARTDLQALGDDVRTRTRDAATHTEGLLVTPLSQSADPTIAQARDLADASVFAGGLLRLWATAVEGYNRDIGPLNTRWREASETPPVEAGLRQELEREEQRLTAALDDEAALIAGHLDRGPNGQGLALLHDEDAISSAELLSVRRDLLTDQGTLLAAVEKESEGLDAVRDMSDADLAAWLRENPDVTDDVWEALGRRVGGWDAGQASADAATIIGAMDRRTDDAGTREAMSGLSLLTAVGIAGQRGGRTLPGTSADYLRTFYGDLDRTEGGLQRFTDWIKQDEHLVDEVRTTQTTVSGYMGYPVPVTTTRTVSEKLPGFDQATQDAMLNDLADGLLLSSDEDLGEGLGADALPQSVKDALADRTKVDTDYSYAGEGVAYLPYKIEGGEKFGELADLLGHASADVEAGDQTSRDLTIAAADVAGSVNEHAVKEDDMTDWISDQSRTDWQDRLQGVVSIASRNEDANATMLHDAARDGSGEGYGDDGSTRADVGAAADLRELYLFDWPDQGKAVAQYTDWIPAAMGDPGTQQMGLQASGDLIEFATETGTKDAGSNTFGSLMQGVPRDYVGEDESSSVGGANPFVARSFAGVAAANLDAFADTPTGGSEAGPDGDDSFNVNAGDRARFFTLVGTDDDAMRRLSITVGAYEQLGANEAIRSGDPVELQRAGEEAAYLEGLVGAGSVNAEIVDKGTEYAVDVADYKANLLAAQVGKNFLGSLIGAVPLPVGPAVASGAFSGLGEFVVQGAITEPPLPDGVQVGDVNDSTAQTASAAYTFAQAKVDAYPDQLPERLSGLLGDDGKLPPLSELSNRELNDLRDWGRSDARFEQYQRDADTKSVYDTLVIDSRGTIDAKSSALNDFLRGIRP